MVLTKYLRSISMVDKLLFGCLKMILNGCTDNIVIYDYNSCAGEKKEVLEICKPLTIKKQFAILYLYENGK